MEARMKLIRWAALSIAVLAILLSSVGCQEKTSTDTGGGGNETVGSIQIVTGTPNDTLRFLPADSASTTVTVIVTDTRGLAMPGQKVDISLANTNLGVIEYVDAALLDTTNSLGRVNCVFRTYAQAGDQIIAATTGGFTAQRTLVIGELEGSINTVTMTVTPLQLEASPLEDDSAQVAITIRDAGNVGVPNVALNVSATGGRLTTPPVTDASGRTITWWYNNREFGNFTIYVRAGTKRDSAIVNVTQVDAVQGTLTLATNQLQIEADGCITAAMITATLKNQFGEAVRNDTVRFGAPDRGAIQPYAITDSLGNASANFCGMLIPNDQDPTDSSKIVARYEKWGIRDTVNVRVVPASGIGNVNLSVANTSGVAGKDSVALTVSVTFANGAPVNGYYVHFRYTQCGDFKYDSLRLVNGHPDSTNFYYLCQAVPTLPVELTAEVDGVFSDPVNININPGAPNRVILNPIAPTTINMPVSVIASVTDTFNNPVRANVPVGFFASFGSITPFSNTNGDGDATASFNPGTTSGVALIKAYLTTGGDTAVTSAQVTSGSANSLTASLVPSSLAAQGSGGQDWSQIQANVFDANGNAVPDGAWVRFILINGPIGANINSNGALDSAQTASGLAVATLNAGTGLGPVAISACIRVGAVETCVPISGSIVAGPPAEIDMGLDEVGEDAGGGAWDVEISALVKDALQNVVLDGTVVFFEVSPPELAQVLSTAVVVGNENMDGDTHPGVAYSTLRYNSLATNSTVQITASTANGIEQTFEFLLPIQEPAVTLNCLPGSWHFNAQGDICHIELQAIVRDGHQVLINGQEVYYSATRGRMYATTQGIAPAISTDFTGPDYGEPVGQCSIWLVEESVFIFPDALTPEIPGEVRVEVVGYQDATDSQVINFRRNP